MTIAILADDDQKNELIPKLAKGIEDIWADSLRSLIIIEADIYFVLQFSFDLERISRLK